MLVVVVRPGLSDHAIPYVEHQGLLAVKAAPRSFALREVQPDGMLVVGDNIVHGDPEGTSRTLRDCPEKPSIWSMPWSSPATGLRPGSWKIVLSANTGRSASMSPLEKAS